MGNAKSSAKRIGKLFENLVAVQARLRAPGGCRWDREQTHSTLRTYLIEEAYEVLDAIETGNNQHLAEELGDLLLQVLFHADLARETGAFDISHVITGIHDKMVRRHPHVFGKVKAETSGEVLRNWVQLKAKENKRHHEKANPRKNSLHFRIGRHSPKPSSFTRSLPNDSQSRSSRLRLGTRREGIFEKLEEETLGAPFRPLRLQLPRRRRRTVAISCFQS